MAQIASECKEFGNKAFKAGDVAAALEKYEKGLRYLNEEPDLDGEPAEEGRELRARMDAARFTLNSNGALMNIKMGSWEDAARMAGAALAVRGVKDSDRAKALYRRGLAHARMKDEDSAAADLAEANALAPGDAAVAKELADVKRNVAARAAKEKAAYKKFFA